jgi:predicted amidohydrolase
MIQTRAIENLLYFVSSTHDKPFPWEKVGIPLGLIVNPGGQVLAEARKGGLIHTSVDLEKRDEDARRGSFHNTYLKMLSRRQPRLYSLIPSH